MPIRGCVVDTETGGLDPRTCALLQIGAVVFDIEDDGSLEIINTDHIHVIPHEELFISEKALKVQGKTWETLDLHNPEHWQEREGFMEFQLFVEHHLWTPAQPLSECHKHIWAWNSDFDYRFMAALASRVPGTAGVFPHRPRWNDIKQLYGCAVAGGAMEDNPKESRSLQDVVKHLGVDPGTPHEALSDALAAAGALASIWKALRGGDSGMDRFEMGGA